MRFNSVKYIVFLFIVFVSYYLLPHNKRWRLLLAASYYFYMSWNPKLIVLIVFTTLVSFFGAIAVDSAKDNTRRRLCEAVSICLCLSTLFVFKYFNFVGISINYISQAFNSGFRIPTLNVILPVGISFYTFQTLSYVIDVYRGRLKASRHLGKYALYVSFFPQLVAGPIERATNLLPQFEQEHHLTQVQTTRGLRQILVGMFKKVVVADILAIYVNMVYNNLPEKRGVAIFIATLFFTFQIYCDFSGYSDIAIGSARLFGFSLMENFKSPFLSTSIKEFWRRWHISLTTWFTDYVYIPLGGSRCKLPRHLLNIAIVFLLSGLWHGANYTFVLWGLYNGVLLCIGVVVLPVVDKIHSGLNGLTHKAFTLIRWGITFVLVNFGFVIFRANNMSDLIYILKNIYRGLNIFRIRGYLVIIGMTVFQFVLCMILVTTVFMYDFARLKCNSFNEFFEKMPSWGRYVIYWGLCTAIAFALMSRPLGTAADFIYFQF